jgi:ABC-type transporter Mla subunit MlaD
MDDRALLERIHDGVERVHAISTESRDFMPAVVGTLEAIGSLMKTIEARMRAAQADLNAELRDLREESRAQREALLRMLDRMDGLDPGGSAA